MKKEQTRRLMLRWQSQVIPAAGSLLRNLFDSADEVLIEYAEKAESNAIQTTFFEGRRELWRKKDEVASLFEEHLTTGLFEFLRPPPRSDAPGAEVLSLVSKDSFERSLALETICEQAIKHHQELYYALSQRLGVISGGPSTPYEQLPAGPYQLAKVFQNAAGVMSVGRQVLLAFYTLFEREVIRESVDWHHELNESLREGGILPNLRYELKLDPNRASHRKEPGAAKAQTEPAAAAPVGAGNPSGSWPATGAANPPFVAGGGSVGNPGSVKDGAAQASAANRPTSRSSVDPALPRYTGFPDHSDDGSPLSQADQGALSSPGLGDPLYPAGGEGAHAVADQLLGRIRDLLVAQRARRAHTGGPVRSDPPRPASPAAVAAAIDRGYAEKQHVLPNTGVFEENVQRVVVTRELLEKLRVALATQRSTIKKSVGEDKLSYLDEDTIDIVGMLFEVMLNDDRLNNTVKALLSHLHTPYLKLAVRDRGFLKDRQHPARLLLENMIEAGSRWVDERDLTSGIFPRLQRIVDLVMKAGEKPLMLLQEINEGLAADIKLRVERQRVREVRTVEAEKGKARLDEAKVAAAAAIQQSVGTAKTPVRYQEFLNGPWTDYMTLLYLRSNGDTDTEIWRGALRLCDRLGQCVADFSAGNAPREEELDVLHTEITQRLGDAIPHYEAKVQQLFALFSGEHEIAIVAPRPVHQPEAAVKVDLSSGGAVLLERLPKLPSGSWVVFHETDGDRVVKLSWFNHKTERFLFVDQAGAKALVVPLKKLADQIDRGRAHVLLATGASYVESSLERALNSLEKRR